MEETNPLSGLGPVVSSPARNPNITLQLDYYPNSYDKGYREGYNQQWNRSANQSSAEKLGYGLASRTISIIPKLGAGLGAILGAGSAIVRQDITDIWDNPINNWFNSLDESLKEKLPVYSSQKNDTSGLLGKMSTASFWASDAFDGIAYAASAFVPGALIGKAAAGISGAMKATEMGASIAKGLAGVGATSHRASLLASTAYNVISEASAEAFQTQKELEVIYLGQGYDSKQAKQKAGESAARVFNANLGVLAAPDLIQNIFFHGGWNNLVDKVRKSVWNKGTLEGVKQLSESWAKAAGVSVASEGFWEENIQTTLQQWEKSAANNRNPGDKRVQEIATNYVNNIGAFFSSFIPDKQQTPDEIEAATSIFLGGVIGLAASTRGHIQEKKQLNESGKSELERYNHIAEAGKTANSLFTSNVGSIYKTNGKKTIKDGETDVEINDYQLDDKGNPILDENAVNNLLNNSLKNKHLWDAHMIAAYRNDPSLAEMNKHMALGSYVFGLMNNKYEYSAEEAAKHLDKVAEIGTEEAKQLGVETFIQDNVSLAKQLTKQFEQIRSKHSSIAKEAEKDPKIAQFNDFLTKTEFYLEIKKKALESIVQSTTTEKGKETAQKLLEDTNDYLDTIKNSIPTVRKQFNESVIAKDAKYGEYNSTKDPERKKQLEYQLAEDAVINGKWRGANSSRELPTQESRLLTKIEPGTRDMYKYSLGKTEITTNRTTTALENNEDIVDIANNFVDGVKYSDGPNFDLVNTQRQEIHDRLDQEYDSVTNEAVNISNVLSELPMVDPDLPSGEAFGEAFGISDEGVQQMLDEVNLKGSVFNLDTPASQVLESPQFQAYISELDAKVQTAAEQQLQILKLKRKLDNLFIANKRIDDYRAAENKERFLKEDFYNEAIKKPVEGFIEKYNQAPEDMMDDNDWVIHEYNLQLALAGSNDAVINHDAAAKLKILSTIWDQILNNINNRAEIHRIVNGLITKSILESLPSEEVAKVLNNESITSFLEKLKQDHVTSFDAIINLLGKVKDTSAKALESTKAKITDTLNDKVTKFIDKIYPNYPELEKLLKVYRTRGDIQENVYLPVFALLSKHFTTKYEDNLPPEFTKFKADLDLFLFHNTVAKFPNYDTEDKQLVKAIKEIYFDAIGASIALSTLDSTLSVDKLDMFKQSMETTPSLQQNITLTQVITFLNSKTSFSDFGSWMLVRGIGGSGKTFFIGNQVKKLSDELLGRPANLLAFSKENMTSANINNAIYEKNVPNTTYETFNALSEEALSKLDYIVIDEVFTFTNTELQSIRERCAKAKVKVVALGDASQLTAEENPAVLNPIQIHMSIPLTTSYRTNVSAISSFIDKYRLNSNPVTSGIASSNLALEDLVTNPSKGYGVLSVTPEGLDMLLRTPSSRSRVLIVPNNNARQQMQANYPNIEVRTAAQAQGIQWDEVYSVLDNDLGQTPFDSNRILYTAYSRAKSLLVTIDPSIKNASPSADLESQVKNSSEELNKIKQMFADNMRGVKDLRDILNGVSPFSQEEMTPEEVTYDGEPLTDVSISNAMGTDLVVDAPQLVAPEDSKHKFAFPRNYGLNDWGDPANAKLARGSRLHFVKTKAKDGTISYYVLGQNRHTPANKVPTYFEVAKLGREDFEGSARTFLNDITKSSKAPIDESEIKGRSEIPADDINRISSGSVTVTDYTKFRTLYGPQYHTERDLIPGAKDIIEDAIIKAWVSYKDTTKEIEKPWVTQKSNGSYEVNWNNIPDSAVSMLIPTKQNTKAQDKFGWNELEHSRKGFHVIYGVPYLVINMESEGKKPLLIRFQPKPLNKNNRYVKILQDLKTNIDTVERVTGLLLGSEEFAELIRNYAHTNFTVEDKKLAIIDSPEPIPNQLPSVELEDAVRNLVRLIFAPNNEAKYFRSEENAKKFLEENGVPIEGSEDRTLDGKRIVAIVQQSSTKWIYKWTSDPVDQKSTEVYTVWKVSEGHGPAQVALNSLAQANNRVGRLQLREVIEKRDKANVTKIVRSPSILLSKDYRDYAGFYKDPFTAEYLTQEQIDDFQIKATKIKDNPDLGHRMLDALTKAIMIKENANYQDAFSFAQAMTDEYLTAPITSWLLDQIVGDGAFDNNGEHTSLRTPLSLSTSTNQDHTGRGINDLGRRLNNEDARNQLTQLVRHNFEGFQKTEVFYDDPLIEKVQVPEVLPTESTIKEHIDKLKLTGNKVYDDIITLLRKFNTNARIIALPNGITVTDKDGNKITKVKASTVVSNGVTTVYSHGFRFSKDMNKNEKMLQIFLHEALHVATKEALEKGMSDVRKKLDTKEALLYKRIQSIKKRFDAAIRSKRNPATNERFKTSEVYQETDSKLDVNEFVASLSKPEFVELAKSISLLPQSNKKSLLRELLETIVNFFKSILGGNPSIYDAAIASLEEFYSTKEIVNSLPEYMQPEVTFKPEDLLSDITKQLEKASEFSFNNVLNGLKSKYQHIIDASTFPENYGDDFTLELTDSFSKMSPIEQSLLLNQSKNSGAWYDISKDRITYSTGSILTASGVTFTLDKLIEDQDFSQREKNLLRSIVIQETLGENLIDELVSGSREEVMDLFFTKIFSNKDKEQFKTDLETTTDNQTKNLLLNPGDDVIADTIANSITRVTSFVENDWYNLRKLVEQSRDRSTARYRIAKQYVESIIKQNLDLDKDPDPQSLIKTTPYLRELIISMATDPNPVLLSGLTLVDAEEKLNKLYAKIKNYDKVAGDPLERNKILFLEIPQLENEITAMRTLGSKAYGSSKLVVDLILKDIYPNSDFSDVQTFQEELYNLAEEGYIEHSDIDTEALELSGIGEHIKKYDQSYETTLSESLKNSFRKITLGDKVISPALAYIKTMQLVMSLDWNIHTNEGVNRPIGLEYIKQQLELTRGDSTSQLTRAIIDNLLETIRYSGTVSSMDVSLDFGDRALGIVAIKLDDNTISYAAYSADVNIPNAHTLTYKEIEYLKSQNKDIKLSTTTKDTAKLSEWLYNQKPHSIKQFNRLFSKGEALNTIRAVVNTMASMKETHLYTANRSSRKGNEFTFQRGTASGVTYRIKDQIKSNLIVFYEKGDLPSLKEMFEARTLNGVRMDKLKEMTGKKMDYIKNFFEFLGVPASDIELRGKGISNMVNAIDGFLRTTKAVEEYSLEDDLSESGPEKFDILEWLDYGEGVDGYIANFSNVLSSSDKLVRNQSVRDAKGKKFHTNHESSHLYKTLLNLIEVKSGNPVFQGGTGSDSLRVIPDFLKSPLDENGNRLPSYYDHNIFVRGKINNKLYSIAEIDGARNTMNNSVTEYTRENMFYFFHRNFNQQFIDGIRQNRNTYFQSTFIPSDSPKALAVRVGILSDQPDENDRSPILAAVEQMFLQLLSRVGLSGAKFELFDKSLQTDLYRDFKLGAKALEQSGLALTKDNIPTLARFVYDQMSIDASNLLDELMSSGVELSLDVNTYKIAQRLLPAKVNGKEQASKLNTKQFKGIESFYGTEKNPVHAVTKQKGEYKVDKTLLLPVFDLWFKNNYVNSYFLNQIIMGDYLAYKNSGGQIKRFAGAKGPGIEGLIDPVAGMRATRKVLVLGDQLNTWEETKDFFSRLLYDDNVPELTPELDQIMAGIPKDGFKPTDAQGFMTSKWIAELSRGFEASWGLGAVHKPIHFSTEQEIIGDYVTAKPVYNKYSAVHLESTMTSKFPKLAKLQRVLEALDVDEAIHKTGVKLGVPIPVDHEGNSQALPTIEDLIKYSDEDIKNLRENWKVSPIMELPNSGYRMQFNAAADPNKQVSLFTQLMYFLNTYPDQLSEGQFETTQDAAKEVYNLVGELIQTGREEFLKSVGSTKEGLVSFLKKNLKGAGSERALALLELGVSIDNPLIEKKAIISLASGLEKATIKTKFKGGKLVLQTPEGTINPQTGKRLSYRKETLPNGHSIIVAECIVPKELLTKAQLDAIQKGDSIYLMPDMLGFRLPSTEFHSALAIRAVGTYSNKKSNIIIAPRELVPIQGQDFDVDALFVITQETFKESETSLIDGVQLAAFTEILHKMLHDLKLAQDNVIIDGNSAPDLRKYKGAIKKLRGEVKDLAGLTSNPELDVESKLEDRVNSIVNKFKTLPAEVSDVLSEVMDHIISFRRLLSTTSIIGEENAPVGYKLEKGKYVIDTSFLEKMNTSLASLESISASNELMPALKGIVRTEINKVKSLKQKYIKNRVIDIMLNVISDRNNAERSMTAISFTSLADAIDLIKDNKDSKDLVISNDNLDLSHPRDQFLAYLSVSSGQILIGGFANASKSFGYISRAGGDERSFVRVNLLKKAIRQLEANPEINVSEILSPLYTDKESDIYKALQTEFTPIDVLKKTLNEEEKEINFISRYANRDYIPVLNPNQAFAIQEEGKIVSYDKLAQEDSDGKYRTTQVYSTLTNAAVDDLNEGFLSRARINTNTGATIIGLTALGVPLRIAVKILYQPVLASLSGGKLNNLEDWIKDLQSTYRKDLEEASDEVVSVERDLNTFIYDQSKHSYQNMDAKAMLDNMSPEDRQSQLRVLGLFIKANKVGTDFRNLAGFLNILRQWDVLMEDIEQVDDTLTDKIGEIVDLPSGEMALKTRNDFSFNIPNLFEGSRHIKEAYASHRALKNKIHDSFRIHSESMTRYAKIINEKLELANKDKKNVILNSIRHSLQDYITSGIESENLPPSQIISYKQTKLVSSGVNVFLNRTAKTLKDIKDMAKEIGDDNLFLENVVITFDKYGTAKISFKTGVGLNPEDQLDLVTGFKQLNEYKVIDGKVTKIIPDSPTYISPFQSDLLKYSVLTSGLSYGGAGFSSYITPQLIKTLDDLVNLKLDNIVADGASDGFLDHFTLSYTLLNASKLAYIRSEDLLPTGETDKKKKIYAGVETLEDKNIYFDLKAKRNTNSKDIPVSMPKFIRRDYGKKISVFKLVHTTDDAAYYQSVGRSDNAVFRPIGQHDEFVLEKQFNPHEPSVAYHYIDNNKITSYSTLLNSLEVGSELYIYPSYSYDRLERQKVKMLSKTKTDLGTQVTFEPVVESIEIVPTSTYPDTLPSEEVADYIVRLKEMGYTEDQIGEALKLKCK